MSGPRFLGGQSAPPGFARTQRWYSLGTSWTYALIPFQTRVSCGGTQIRWSVIAPLPARLHQAHSGRDKHEPDVSYTYSLVLVRLR